MIWPEPELESFFFMSRSGSRGTSKYWNGAGAGVGAGAGALPNIGMEPELESELA